MKRCKLLSILIALVLLYSCSSFFTTYNEPSKEQQIKKMCDSYMGITKNQLVRSKWGAPKYVRDDGSGGQILVYEEPKTIYVSGYGRLSVMHQFQFFINNNGKTYDWIYKNYRM